MNKFVFPIFFLFVFSGCSDNLFNDSRKSILTGSVWELDHCINTSENTIVAVSFFSYRFYSDGTYIIVSENGNTGQGNWELLQDEEYLKIGTNIFRIKSISGRLLVLKYGELEFVFTPPAR
jgi:hypothetical protein